MYMKGRELLGEVMLKGPPDAARGNFKSAQMCPKTLLQRPCTLNYLKEPKTLNLVPPSSL